MVKNGAIKALASALAKYGNRQSIAENVIATLSVFVCSRDAYLKMVARELSLPLLTQVMSDFLHLRALQGQCFQMLDKMFEKYRTKQIEICDIGAVVSAVSLRWHLLIHADVLFGGPRAICEFFTQVLSNQSFN